MTSDKLREKVAKAICTADEQNGGPPWGMVLTMGKHVVAGLYDRADAAIAVVLEEAARVAESMPCKPGRDGPQIAAAIRALKSKKEEPGAFDYWPLDEEANWGDD